MLISEQLLSILSGNSGRCGDWALRGIYGLRGAVLADLLLAGRLDLTPGRDPMMRVIDNAPTNNPILDHVLSQLPAGEGIRFSSAIGRGERSVKGVIAEHGAAGPAKSDNNGAPEDAGPTPEPGAGIVDRLIAVLAGERPATAADQVLLSILKGLGLGRAVLPSERTGLSWSGLYRRIKEITDENAPGEPLRAMTDSLAALTIIVATADGNR
ncbi:GOLPH3/VPS74 family protein [Actinomyces sp. zg328]|uniref:GOLPH3/VPS74 family protein n=1 Tax=Actinomyces sp. zg328 TaxID=2609287 RepID=UPI00135676F8|nr:GPP34 family phosphoprotein [Actinomyces sp. zg328]